MLTTVEDPYDGKPLSVRKNICESPVEKWFAKGTIDGGQYAAANKFRSLWETSKLGGAKAFDYEKEKVDGGTMSDPISDRSMDARRSLKEAKTYLGQNAYAGMVALVGEGMSIKSMASYSHERTERELESYSWWMRETLNHLVKHWGLIAEGRR